MRIHTIAAILGLGLAAGVAMAQTAAPATATAITKEAPVAQDGTAQVGDATRRLLALQAASGGAPRGISGDVATLSYQRYLDSFKNPIPALAQPTGLSKSASPTSTAR